MSGDGKAERASLLGDGNPFDDDSDSDIEDIRPAPSGGRTPNPSSKVNLVKEHVDEVMGIMRTNITKTIERGDKMEAIVDKTDELAQSADVFKARSKQLRRRMWWNNVKIQVMIGFVIVCIIGLIIAYFAL